MWLVSWAQIQFLWFVDLRIAQGAVEAAVLVEKNSYRAHIDCSIGCR